MGREENAVVAGCLGLLAMAGAFAWRHQSGGARVKGRGGKPMVLMFGGIRGAADIIAVCQGIPIAVECKKPAEDPVLMQACGVKPRKAGTQSKYQKEWQAGWERAGGIYVLAHRSEILEDKLVELGLLKRQPEPNWRRP